MYGFELTPEQKQLKQTVHKFAVEEIIPVAAQYDKEEQFPDEICRKAWDLGILNPLIPTAQGGLGLEVFDTCRRWIGTDGLPAYPGFGFRGVDVNRPPVGGHDPAWRRF